MIFDDNFSELNQRYFLMEVDEETAREVESGRELEIVSPHNHSHQNLGKSFLKSRLEIREIKKLGLSSDSLLCQKLGD